MPNRHLEAADLYVRQLEVTRCSEPTSFLELTVVRQISLGDSPEDLPRLKGDSRIEEL